jgi:hypothetical protein
VYFRQRHGSPLVAPVALDSPADCGVLDDLFHYYCQKAGATRRETSLLHADAMEASHNQQPRVRSRRRSIDHTTEFVVIKKPEREPAQRDVDNPRKRRKVGEVKSPKQL